MNAKELNLPVSYACISIMHASSVVDPRHAKRRSFIYAPTIFMGNSKANRFWPGKKNALITMHPSKDEAAALQFCTCKVG